VQEYCDQIWHIKPVSVELQEHTNTLKMLIDNTARLS
jgi:glycogen phosphorylase